MGNWGAVLAGAAGRGAAQGYKERKERDDDKKRKAAGSRSPSTEGSIGAPSTHGVRTSEQDTQSMKRGGIVKRTGRFLLHRGETVIPARKNRGGRR
jgi:hypothetical protein